jgi:YaiO family outer membrane protein
MGKRNTGAKAGLLAAFLATAMTIGAQAAPPASAASPVPDEAPAASYVELGGDYHWLSHDYSDWYGFYVRGAWVQSARNTWDWEIARRNEYDEWGGYYAGGLTHVFNADWYGSLHLGASSSGFFLPRYRGDAFLNRKLLPARNLVATGGGGYIEERDDVHRQSYLFLGGAYYFTHPWIVEGGARWTQSDPGSVDSSRLLVAVTWGRDQWRFVTAAYESGNEAYLLVDGTVAAVDFHSQLLTLTWREWWRRGWGHNVVAEHYESEVLDRTGVRLGVFKEF